LRYGLSIMAQKEQPTVGEGPAAEALPQFGFLNGLAVIPD